MRIDNIKTPVTLTEDEVFALVRKKAKAPKNARVKLLKKSLDARDKAEIKWVYTVECSEKPVTRPPREFEKITKPAPRVYIAGAGPAGLFCALRLLDHGIRPVEIGRAHV